MTRYEAMMTYSRWRGGGLLSNVENDREGDRLPLLPAPYLYPPIGSLTWHVNVAAWPSR